MQQSYTPEPIRNAARFRANQEAFDSRRDRMQDKRIKEQERANDRLRKQLER